MIRCIHLLAVPALCLFTACGGSEDHPHPHDDGDASQESATDEGGGEDHAHAEESLGSVMLGDLSVELAQGHGAVEAGKEAHLVVKLPYSDDGATVVRAWIGTEDRTASYVGRGQYAASHDDYDVHATAPDPLPTASMWWVEIERPDGTTLVGSAQPILD